MLVACTSRKPTRNPEPVIVEVVTVPAPAQPVEFVILQMNDVYEISPMNNGQIAGMARVAAVRKELLKANPNVITVLDGDYLSPSLIGSLKCDFGGQKQTVAGRHMVDVMNAVGVDYVTFGNHEFDVKEAENIARNQESRFQIISANVLHQTSTGQTPFEQGGTEIPKEVVHRFKSADGQTEFRLGLTGVTLPFNLAKYVHYEDHYSTVAESMKRLEGQSDAVMAITHLTMEMDDTLARRVPGMPLILGGHEHVNMYRQVGNTVIAKADANAKTLYIHWCKYDPTTKKVSLWSQLYPVTSALPEDAEVAAVVKKWEDFAEECMESQGYAPNDTLGFYITPLDGREESIRFMQTNLGTLIVNSMLAADPASDCAVMNSGSVRLDGVLQGFVTQRDILATLPFGGGISHGSVKGSDLKRLLDAGLNENLKGNGGYLQVGNITQQGSSYLVKGKPLVDTQTYMLAMPSFMASGGENSLSFVKDFTTYSDPKLPTGVKNDIRDIVIWNMKKNGNLDLVKQMMKGQ